MYDHYCIIWLSILGDDEASRAATKGKKCANILVLGWFLIKHSLNFLNTLR